MRNEAPSFGLLLICCSCASQPVSFETSDEPPQRKPSGTVAPLAPEIAALPVSKVALQETTESFLLAVENRSATGLGEVLSSDAIVRTESDGSSSPAAATLMQLASTWSPTLGQGEAVGFAPSPPPFGPAEIVDISVNHSTASALIDVAGPAKVRGKWEVRFVDAAGRPQIAEVVLPKSR